MKKSEDLLKKDVWPQERDIFERPDRWKYVRKIVAVDGCVFCEAREKSSAKIDFESLVLLRTPRAFVLLNKYPYNSGHIMVLPLRHCGDLTELSIDENFEIQKLIHISITILKKVYSCVGFNVGANLGAVAGAGIPEHLHWHIIPRWAGDTNFFPLIAETKVIPETLEQTYSKLRPEFEKVEWIDLEVDHIGIAVRSIEEQSQFYKDLGLVGLEPEVVEREKVRVQMFELANRLKIELIEATAPESPIQKFIDKKGPGLQQLCFRVFDIKKTMSFLKEKGYRLINENPVVGAHGALVAFVHPESTGGVLVEISQPKRELNSEEKGLKS